jgi:hypothetical protein
LLCWCPFGRNVATLVDVSSLHSSVMPRSNDQKQLGRKAPPTAKKKLRDMRTLSLYIDRVERRTSGHEQAIAFGASETDIAADLR